MKIGVVEPNTDTRTMYLAVLPRLVQQSVVVPVESLPPFKLFDGSKPESLDVLVVEPESVPVSVWLTSFRSSHPNVPIIIASERPDILSIDARQFKNTAALTKPFHISELAELIDVFVGEGETSDDMVTH